ncbi:MAG TPA: ferredoxin [Opitutaceae bacterium]|nr:ferredoxin [Opitutaceae bacterium]
MANSSDRNPDNVPGRYYVDSSCIDCDQCRNLAPDFFARNPDTGLGYVQRQPVTDDEIAAVEEALAACATSSIGNDGA